MLPYLPDDVGAGWHFCWVHAVNDDLQGRCRQVLEQQVVLDRSTCKGGPGEGRGGVRCEV